MKIESTSDAVVTSNVPTGDVTDMKIDPEGMEHIMTLLTNLYKDPELAVIREYYTNALDAHVASGSTEKVLVTLPTWDSPVYEVQDFGIGMSDEDIRNIYSQYGASTKRKTNNQVGAFGLGCKAALAISTQFTLVSVKDGRKTTALVSKTTTGVNTVTIVSNIPTEEPNGTTVKIPVPNDRTGGVSLSSFNDKARSFFQFSKPGLVLVDGEAPSYKLDGATEIPGGDDPDLLAYTKSNDSYYYQDSYIIMGNVPYVLSLDEMRESYKRMKRDHHRNGKLLELPKFFPVPIGSVDLTPSREGLRFTEKTNSLIDKLLAHVEDHLLATAQMELDAITNISQYWEVENRWRKFFDPNSLTYKGKTVPRNVKADKELRTVTRSRDGSSTHSVGSFLDISRKATIITGVSSEQYSRVNMYLGSYMWAEDIRHATFIITDDTEILKHEWVAGNDNFTVLTSDHVLTVAKKYRRDERARAKKDGVLREKLRYPVVDLDKGDILMVEYDKIDKNLPYLDRQTVRNDTAGAPINSFFTYSRSDSIYARRHLREHLASITPARKIILIGGSRTEEALLRRVPTAYNILKDAEKARDEYEAGMTDDLREYASGKESSWYGAFTALGLDKHLDKLKDKAVRHFAVPPTKTQQDTYNALVAKLTALHYFTFRNLKIRPMSDTSKSNSAKAIQMHRKYPLIDKLKYQHVPAQHVVLYMNAVHEQERKDKRALASATK